MSEKRRTRSSASKGGKAQSNATQLALRQRRRRRSRSGRRGFPKLWIFGPLALFFLGIIAVSAGAGAVYGVYQSFADDLVEPTDIELTQRFLGTSKVFDLDGEEGELLFEFSDPLSGLRNPIKLETVSAHLINATVSTEDATFFDNSGINTRGILRAAWENIGLGFGSGDFLGGSGGSSITQQLVKNVLLPLEERTERTVSRKLKETILALELTSQYPKTQILEWYLNSIFYGSHAFGIGAASQRFFDKPAPDLSLAEAALLAGLPQAPATHDPFTNPIGAKARQADVLDLMAINGYISRAEAEQAKREPLNFGSQQFEIQAPHFVLYVQDEVSLLCERGQVHLPDGVQSCEDIFTDGGLRITTTLDLDLQRQAEQILAGDLATFEEQTGAGNAALVSIDPTTGEIRAMVGSRNFFREDVDGQVNNAIALNSPGSSIKPLTYVTGFLRDPERWNPATIVWDVPLDFIEADGSVFTPENFDSVFRGPVSVRSALANSMNVPAFRVADELGVGTVLDVAHRLGFTTMQDLSLYGPSITLGGGDVKLIDMVLAYSVFANEGIMRGQRTLTDLPFGNRALDPVAIKEIRDVNGTLLYELGEPIERRVLPAPQAYQITSILSDNAARSTLYGLNSTLVLDRPAAAKTGTAGEPGRNDERRDFWTVGYTPQLVTGVWVGNADNSPMTSGSSSRTAGLIWHDFMLAAHQGIEPTNFNVPDGLTTSEVFVPQLRLIRPGEDRDEFPSQNPCGTSISEIFVADAELPAEGNRICSEVEVDSRTFLLASADTPATALREGYFLLPPIDPETQEPVAEIVDWLRLHKVRFVGDQESSEDAVFARIDTPPNGAELGTGAVLVRGRAAGDGVTGWKLEYAPIDQEGASAPDSAFVELIAIDAPIRNGQLARWDTAALDSGFYILRLTVEHDFLGAFVAESRVSIEEPPEDAGMPDSEAGADGTLDGQPPPDPADAESTDDAAP